jgi:hypothetical protein
MPPFEWSAHLTQGVHGQNAQLAAVENFTTLSILMACFSRILQIRETSFTYIKRAPIVAFKRANLKF